MSASAVLLPLVPPSVAAATVAATGASGARILFADGVEAIDVASGLWNVPFGHGRPEFTAAIADALAAASYLPLFRRGHPWAERAAAALLSAVGGSFPHSSFTRVFFTTSGGSANDAVMKLLRQRAALLGRPDRRLVVGLSGSYHGLTYGAHALSGDRLAQDLYGVDRSGVRHVAHDDPGALESLLLREGRRICGIVVEPVLGSGALELSDDVLAVLQRASRDGVPVVADEVATGFGRAGPFLASSRWPFVPDAVVLSKALTNGTLAAAAVVLGERLLAEIDAADAPFVHAETQAGTPAVCAAVLESLARLPELLGPDGFPRVSAGLDRVIDTLGAHPRVLGHSGVGCFRALRIRGVATSAEVLGLVEEIRRRGAVVHPAPGGIQFLPAAVVSDADLAVLPGIVGAALDA
ncbi:aspartate aminotransferase family protein [Rathayibacter sp. VKM Ac-2856]|uniref:daptide-type RiPP biosynthesis aminotransferase n=1 Tax=unclassified Rathayibacter TaxID=2609250 RepID=UPI0015632044|nr:MULTISPECIES: daptide-type RiPP biosynthesis aminotransferase [unclassified Rathayibacter]NQX04198.1 aspartate aminotransferase family protein [Rathayibacter sp. VKM Ac-2858]NQX19367.1 aspartate aminotransferase family protein [Rathayibacter sp. VKM Ac-2856]